MGAKFPRRLCDGRLNSPEALKPFILFLCRVLEMLWGKDLSKVAFQIVFECRRLFPGAERDVILKSPRTVLGWIGVVPPWW
jgi:hypothetical protein